LFVNVKPTFAPMKQKMLKYFSGRKPGWWISNMLLVLVVVMLVVPSFRMWVVTGFLRLTMGAPSLELRETRPATDDEVGLIVQDTNGQVVSLSDSSNQVVFVNIWATWCGPCVAEMSSIEDLYADYGDRVLFILLSYEEPEVVKGFKNKREIALPLFTLVSQPPPLFQVKSYPTTFIINKKRQVVVHEKGAGNWNHSKVRDLLDDLLSQ